MFLCYMQTVKDVYQLFRAELASVYDANETEALTGLVLNEVTRFSKANLKAFTDAELTTAQSDKVSDILADLKTGKPLQYIFGYTEFYGLKLFVSPAVLIPRPETEELVEWIIETTGKTGLQNILDIGTGSGCIAISLTKNLPLAGVSAIDISAEALAIAERNAVLNVAEVKFMQADALNLRQSKIADERYHIIVSNPPYVTPADKEQMHTNVTNFEPHTALFVPQDDPLLFYKAIADFGTTNLTTGGYLFFEINESYGQKTVDMLAGKGYRHIELRKDMSGRDRMVKAVWL